MKKKYKVKTKNGKEITKEITYVPGRFIIAMLITILETLLAIGLVIYAIKKVPYIWIPIILIYVLVIVHIIASNDNPDYKIPWIIVIGFVPIAGIVLYFLFGRRIVTKREQRKIRDIVFNDPKRDIILDDELINSQKTALLNISGANIYTNTNVKYYSLGDYAWSDMLIDLENAKEFIFMEYFIIENGMFYDSIEKILLKKAKEGVEVKLIYDDIGCMTTLPEFYFKRLQKQGIKCYPFNLLKGQANSEFNNRNHRKMTIIDGKIAYTGGYNLADEYVNKRDRFGIWKDSGIRLEGEAVNELTKLFLTDYIHSARKNKTYNYNKYFRTYKCESDGYLVPYGDGPRPFYDMQIAKIAIINMLNNATSYAYITTPYLIVDKELLDSIMLARLRGVVVKIIIPGVPDKKLVYWMTERQASILHKSGVEIYSYKKGFIHSKNYIVDGNVAMIGTVNLDYRSLTHHYENAIWMYNSSAIKDMKHDFIETLNDCKLLDFKKKNIFKDIIIDFISMFQPML